MSLVRIKNGKPVKISAREAKQTVMRAHGWTAEEYRKKYDIFKNKVRAYEEYKRSHGETVTKQSPAELLYKQARAMLREGKDYTPSKQMQYIESFTAVSMGKAGKKLVQSALYQKKVTARMSKYVTDRFAGLISYYHLEEQVKQITDPFKLEKMLTDYANELHKRGVRDHGGTGGEAIPYGEVSGSDPAIDFDFSMYFD